jgi:hypothetical protein
MIASPFRNLWAMCVPPATLRSGCSPATPEHLCQAPPAGIYTYSPRSLGLSATGQQYFSLTANQPSATRQQYSSLWYSGIYTYYLSVKFYFCSIYYFDLKNYHQVKIALVHEIAELTSCMKLP